MYSSNRWLQRKFIINHQLIISDLLDITFTGPLYQPFLGTLRYFSLAILKQRKQMWSFNMFILY